MKRSHSILRMALCLCAVFFISAGKALAAPAPCGSGVVWELDAAGVLTVSGSGAMDDYSTASRPPWYDSGGSITAVRVENGVTRIGDNAFNFGAPTKITAVSLPASLTAVGDRAFLYSRKIETVAYGGTAAQWDEIDFAFGNGCLNLVKTGRTGGAAGDAAVWEIDGASMTLTITGTGPLAKVDILKARPEWFYYANTVSRIVIGEGITVLPDESFAYMGLAETLVIPNSVTSIGATAFTGCDALRSITMPGSARCPVSSYEYEPRCFEGEHVEELTLTSDVMESFSKYYFNANKTAALKKLTVAGDAEKIGANAFNNLASVEEVTLSDRVTALGASCMNRMDALAAVKGGAGVESVGTSVFSASCPYAATDTVLLGKVLVLCRTEEETLAIPEGVKTIAYGAFNNNATIKKVTFPASLETIEMYAFTQCFALEHIELPDGVKTVGEQAFRNCTSLKSAVIGSGLAELPSRAFDGCAALESVTLSEGLQSIGYNAFHGCEALTEITLPSTVTTVGFGAFQNCLALKKAVLPDGLSEIAYSLFEGCTALEEADLPAAVASIGQAAFNGCASLKHLTVPEGVASIGGAAFIGCSGLREIEYNAVQAEASEQIFKAEPEGEASCALTIGPNVLSFSAGCFKNAAHIASVTFTGPADVGAEELFCGMTGLCSADLSAAGGDIAKKCFYGCTSLAELKLPPCAVIGEDAFGGCTSLKTVDLPASVHEIGERAFSGCTALEEAPLPAGIEGLNSETFAGCTALRRVSIPASVVSIGSGCFRDCPSLEAEARGDARVLDGWAIELIDDGDDVLTIPEGVVGVADGFTGAAYHSYTGTALSLPEGLKTIGASAFRGLSTITAVELPSTLETLGDEAFRDCTSLASVTGFSPALRVGRNAFLNTALKAQDGFLIIGTTLVSYTGSGRSTVTVPDGVTAIAFRAFVSHREIRTVILPEGLLSIDEASFAGCRSLTSVDLPDSLTSIGKSAFSDCALTSVRIPSGMKHIPEQAFWNCGQLAAVELPEGLLTIGDRAFGDCPLTELTLPRTLTYIGSDALLGSMIETLDLPAGVSLAGGALSGCTRLRSVTFDGRPMSYLGFVRQYGAETLHSTAISDSVTNSWYYEGSAASWFSDDSLIQDMGRLYARTLIEKGEVATLKDCYDWLCEFCGYQFANGMHLSASDGPFFYGYASCQGVALVMQCFLDELGIPSFVMTGTVNGTYGKNVAHAWNEVREGGWRLVDATDTDKGDYSTFMLSEGVAYVTDWDKNRLYTIDWDKLYAGREACANSFVRKDTTDDPLTFELQADGTYAVARCANVGGDVVIPARKDGVPVTAVAAEAFRDCVWLESVTIPEGIVSLGDRAFYHCIGLTDVTLPSTVRSLGVSVFERCVGLERADLSQTALTDLPYGTFINCLSLMEIDLPDSVGAFAGLDPRVRTMMNSTADVYYLEITAPAGSAAERAAEEKGLLFTAVGEHDTAQDGLQIVMHILSGGDARWPLPALSQCDLDGDGALTARDAARLIERSAGKLGGTAVLAVSDGGGRQLLVTPLDGDTDVDLTALPAASGASVFFLDLSSRPLRAALVGGDR